MQAELDTSKTSLAAANETIAKHEHQLQQDRIQHEDVLRKLRAEMEEKQQQIVIMGESMATSQREMDAALASHKSAADKAKEQLADLQGSSAKTIADLQEQVKKANDELAALNNKHAEVTSTKAIADHSLADMKSQLADLQAASSKTMARVDDLERQLVAGASEIASKDEEIIGLQFVIDEFVHQKRASEEQAATSLQELAQERAQTDARLSKLIAANAESEAQATSLMNSLTHSKNNDAAVKALLVDLQVKLADDRTQLSRLELALGTANGKIKKHEVAHASLIEELDIAKQRTQALEDQLQRNSVELADQIKLRQLAEHTTAQHIKELASATLLVDEATTSTRTAQMTYDRNIADLRAKRSKDAEEAAKIQKQLADLHASSAKTTADLQAQLKKANDELAALTSKHTELTTAKDIVDHTVADLKSQLADLQILFAKTADDLREREKSVQEAAMLRSKVTELVAAQDVVNNTIQTTNKQLSTQQESSGKTIVDLQAQLKRNDAELAVMTKKYAQLTSEKSTEDERVKELERLMRVDSDALDNTKRFLADAQEQEKRHKDELATKTKAFDELAAEKTKAIARVKEMELLLKAKAEEYTKATNLLADAQATAEKDHIELKKQLADLQTSSTASIADAQAQLKTRNDELASMTKANTDLTTAKAAIDKKLDALNKEHAQHLKECKLAAEKAGKSIADAQAQLKKSNDELTSMTKANTELTTAKAAADKELQTLKNEYTQHLKECKLAAEKAGKSIADAQAQLKTGNDELASILKTNAELTIAKDAADKELQTLKNEYTQHLKECKLAAEKASKSIAEAQAQLKTRNDELAAMTKTNTELSTALNALTIEYRQYKESKENSSRELSSQNKRDAASISALRKQIEDVTKMNTALTTAKAAVDQEIQALQKQLASLQTSSAQTITELQKQLQEANDELGALKNSYSALTVAKDRDFELLTSAQRNVTELALALKTNQDELLALGKKHSALVSDSQKQSTELVIQTIIYIVT